MFIVFWSPLHWDHFHSCRNHTYCVHTVCTTSTGPNYDTRQQRWEHYNNIDNWPYLVY